ncbi:MAG TPA: 6-phosphogluconolactonase [Paludibacter sp.]|nr:6-phosphogluconolactonase [Paludibacter sp.]
MNHIYETPEETARAVAELILAKAKEKTKQSLPFNIALSGGSTPKLLFTLLANEYVNSVPWHFVRLFWVDERCVPPTHPESNFGMTYNSLLVHVPIHDSNIFRMQGEDNPTKEAVRYQKMLEKELPLQDGFPQFDLVLLGMGDDGHTASIFPDNMSLLQSDQAVAVGVHPVSNQERITLTGKTILEAKQVVFLITGAAKASVLRQIIKCEPKGESYPTFYVAKNAKSADFYLDQPAASLL